MGAIAVTVGTIVSSARRRLPAPAWLQAAVGAAVIAVLVLRLGAGPFLTALASVHLWAVAAAMVVAAGSTLCAAYRWRLVTIGLDVPVGFGPAVRAYYASQFLNATLPAGVLGDVHRGLRHGREGSSLGTSLRAVAWERLLGQAIQVLLAGTLLLAAPSPLRPPPVVAVAVGLPVAAGLAVAWTLLVRRRRRPGSGSTARPETPARGPASRAARRIAADWRGIASLPSGGVKIALASAGAVAGHVLVFLLSALSVDAGLPLVQLVPMALVVLVIASVPLNLAGWGPREGAAGWVFAVAGLGAAQGVSVSVVYGVLALLGTLPGAAVLLAGRHRGWHGGRHG